MTTTTKRMTPAEAADELVNLIHDADAFTDVTVETDSENRPVVFFRSANRAAMFSMTIKMESRK